MDEIQKKLVELTKNLTALDTCMTIGKLQATDIILYLQHDIPIEKTNKYYSYMKETFQEPNVHRYTLNERNENLTAILHQVQAYILVSEKDQNMTSKVYKEAYDIAEEICYRLEKQLHPILPGQTVPY